MRNERSTPEYLTDDDLLRIKTKQEVRRWLIHLTVFLLVQIVLIPYGYSIFSPLAQVVGGPGRHHDLAYQLTEGWTFILMLDALDALVVLSWPAWPKVRDFIMDR